MMIPLIVIGVLFLILAASLWQSASNWTWIPIVSVLFIFVTAVFAGIYTSKTLKTRHAWMRKDQENQRLADQALAERDEALYGPADAISFPRASLTGTNNTLNLMMVGQGRIWRGGQPTPMGDGNISMTFTDQGGPSPTSQLKQDMQVFGFADRGTTIDDVLVTLPVQFVGTWQVDSITADSVVLKPLFIAEYSAGEAGQPTTSWTLFETMPGDAPHLFRDDLNLADFDINTYRAALRDQYLPADTVGLDPDSKEYEALLDQYTFDGLSMNVIQQWIDAQQGRINDRFDPDVANLESEIRFTENSPPLTVDGTGNPSTDGIFDTEGHANDPNLQLGSDVTIRTEDDLRVPKLSWEDGYEQADGNNRPPLNQEWSAESIVEFYSRPLRDYPYALRELGYQAAELQESVEAMKADIEVSQAMIDNTNAQISTRNDLIVKLQSDISRRQQELEQITTHSQNLEQELARRQAIIRTYYQQMLELHRGLTEPSGAQNTGTGTPTDSVVTNQ